MPNFQFATNPHMLIAMVSGDVIVLAKLVRTLRPKHILLFCTAHARKKGWVESAELLLSELKQHRPEIVTNYKIVDLAKANLQDRLNIFQSAIYEECTDIHESPAAIALDCTTGQGIFHALGFDLLRRLGEEHNLNISTVYCDADTATIICSSYLDKGFKHISQPVNFRYWKNNELDERFGIYGVSPTSGERLWPTNEDGKDHDLFCQLYGELCVNESLRALFHSYWYKGKRWKYHQSLESSEHQYTDIPVFLDEQIRNIAENVRNLTKIKNHKTIVQQNLHEYLTQYIGTNNDTKTWLKNYLTDRKLKELNRILQNQSTYLKNELVGNNRNINRQSLDNLFASQLKSLLQNLRQRLDAIALAQGHEPTEFTPDEHRKIRIHELENIDAPDAVKEFLSKPDIRLPDLFETCIGHAVTRIAKNNPESVATVVQNVEFSKGERLISELDTLILFHNADISVLEAKTHRENAEFKKIESNIKQLRDFCGAYSVFHLIYPLTEKELQELIAADASTLKKFTNLGMEDAANWQRHLKNVHKARDQNIIGLDQLEQLMGS